jgi:hypothetical protein
MAAIIAGEADMTFNDCESRCGTYFALIHNVNGAPEEVSTVIVNGGLIATGKEVALVKSENVRLELDGVDVKAENNVLVRTVKNDDPCTTKTGDNPYGVYVVLKNMNVEGDLLHEDPERSMWIELESTTYKGAIKEGNLEMDVASKWVATADSTVTFTADIYPSQIDALSGVTITAQGGEAGEYDLASGGKLIVKA